MPNVQSKSSQFSLVASAIEKAVDEVRRTEATLRWQQENAAAIEEHNGLIEIDGMLGDHVPGWWNDYTPIR